MIESSRELGEARRFRSRVIAQNLAENGAELAAVKMALPERASSNVHAEDWQGEISGQMQKTGSGPLEWPFKIEATGKTSGLVPIETKVVVIGRVVIDGAGAPDVRIQYTMHTP
jgi:hypothetical protein